MKAYKRQKVSIKSLNLPYKFIDPTTLCNLLMKKLNE